VEGSLTEKERKSTFVAAILHASPNLDDVSHPLKVKAAANVRGSEVACYLWEDIEISNIEEGRASNSWLIRLWF